MSERRKQGHEGYLESFQEEITDGWPLGRRVGPRQQRGEDLILSSGNQI